MQDQTVPQNDRPTVMPGPAYFKAVAALQGAIRALMSADVADPYGYVAMVAAESGGLAAEQHKLIRQAGPAEAEAGPRADLAQVLRGLALDIIDFKLPLPRYYFTLRACLESRAEVQAWANHFGTPVKMGGTGGDIPCAEQEIEFGDGQSIRLVVQGPTEPVVDPEKAALAARVAELEAQLAEGGVQ